MVKLARTYIEEGITRFAQAAKNFLEDFGEDAHLYGSLFEMKTYVVAATHKYALEDASGGTP
jgi:hypothetical protein